MAEQRAATRQRTFWKGTILFAGGLRSVECTVRNYSDAGARLSCPATADIPEHFELHIPQKGVVLRCRAVWRTPGEIGAAFLAPAAKEQGEAMAEKLRKLEEQNKKLLRKVQERAPIDD